MHISGRIISNLFVSEISYYDVPIPTQSFPYELLLKLCFVLINAFPYNTALKDLDRKLLKCATCPAPSRKRRCPLPCRERRFTWTLHGCLSRTCRQNRRFSTSTKCLLTSLISDIHLTVCSLLLWSKTALAEVLSCYVTYCSPVAKLS